MAVSKAFLFHEDEQLASIIGQAMSHPAKMRMLRRLIPGQSIPYTALVEGMPLTYNAIKQHVDHLKRLQLIKPAMLENNLAGFVLNVEFYLKCTAASRRIMRRNNTPVYHLGKEGEGLEAG
ncbi:MAG: hypothetical protein AB8H12_11870 [Lewinella sp.]